MNIQKLNALLSGLNKHAKDIESLEDLKLVAMIGTGTAEGKTLCAKQILHLGAPASIRRRLDRLVKLGHVIKSRSVADVRVLYLRLSSGMTKALGKTFKAL